MTEDHDVNVRSDHVVTISYQFTDTGGADYEELQAPQTVTYLHGHNQLLPGLERAIEGMTSQQTADLTIEPDGAFGPHHDELVIEIERERIGFEVTVGDVIRAELPDGQQQHLQVINIGDTTVTLDGNHPLAGKTLGVHVTVDEIRQATDDELANGKVDDSTSTVQ